MTGQLPARARPLSPGEPAGFGAYEVIGFLGRGGMGVVYLGRGPGGELVAIKVVRAEFARVPEFRERFRREAESAMRVPRFCTAEMVAADPDAAEPYLVTEYIDGPTLKEVVQSGGPLRRAELDQLGVSVAAALTGIHATGIVHRDLKPANVLLSRMGPRVIDFGIANAADAMRLTVDGQALGTPAYMAPEQMRGHAGPASDVFAWGGVMVFAATGRHPFGTGPLPVLAARLMYAEPDLDGLTEPMRGIVAAALTKDQTRRPAPGRLLELMGVAGTDPAIAVQTRLAGMGLPGPATPESAAVTWDDDVPRPPLARSGTAPSRTPVPDVTTPGTGLGAAGSFDAGFDAPGFGAAGSGGAGSGAAGLDAGVGGGAAAAGGGAAPVAARTGTDDRPVTFRFGPGVPARAAPDEVTRIWRDGTSPSKKGRWGRPSGGPHTAPGRRGPGTGRPGRTRTRSVVSGLVSLLVFGALAAWLILQNMPGDLLATGLTVKAAKQAKTCGDVKLTGKVTTNGEAGRLTYQWKLSDRGQPEAPRQITIAKGTTDVRLSFVWQFSGRGSPAEYTATLVARGAGQSDLRDSVTFTYACAG